MRALCGKECLTNMPMKVVVEPHNPRWADMFDIESKMVAQALGSNAIKIHHISSTAIPVISANLELDYDIARSHGMIAYDR